MNAAATNKHAHLQRSIVETREGSVRVAAMLGVVKVHREGMSLTPHAARMLAAELMSAATAAELQGGAR